MKIILRKPVMYDYKDLEEEFDAWLWENYRRKSDEMFYHERIFCLELYLDSLGYKYSIYE